MKKIILILAVAAVFLLASCDSGPTIISPSWESSGGWMVHETNDENYYDYWFSYTFSSTEDILPVEIQAKKMSGAGSYGYGVIFGKLDDGSYWRIGLTINGYYAIQRYNGSSWDNNLVDWTISGAVNTGYDAVNTIKVEHDSTNYNILINSVQVHTFLSDDVGGRAGFWTSVGEELDEEFPETCAEARFQFVSPTIIF